MKKILISWLAFNDDFQRDQSSGQWEVTLDGPTMAMHEHFFDYERHVILHVNRPESEYKAELLRSTIAKVFPDHTCQLRSILLPEKDLITVSVIQAKVRLLLMDYRDEELDLFVTPGTPAMHTVWHIEHLDPERKTRLLQVRPARYAENGQPELIKIDFDHSEIPGAALIQEQNVLESAAPEDTLRPKLLDRPYFIGKQIARADRTSCLILGDSGTGKEVLAKYILKHSPRRSGPFRAINCSSLPDDLLTSLLFGYKKGSFTGAIKDSKGYFEQCHGGTIFLDEIGDISPLMQQSLLRVLQEGEVTPLGAEESISVDVRVIAATNRNLIERCKKGEFRWDLYYRLSVVEIELPRLVEWNKTALKDLLNFFLQSKQIEFGRKKRLKLPRKIKSALLDYHFPGNIREMENLVSRLYVLSDEEAKWEDLPLRIRELHTKSPMTLDSVEEVHIRKVLRMRDGNLTQVAKTLGIWPNTLKSKMEKYKIDPALVNKP